MRWEEGVCGRLGRRWVGVGLGGISQLPLVFSAIINTLFTT